MRAHVVRILWYALACALTAAPAAAHEDDEPPPARPGLRAPVLIERVEPVYPEAARAGGLGGVVGLELDVGVDGHVTAVRVVRAAGFGFDEAAVAAAQQFTFRPATRNGKPIAATLLFDQTFVVRPHLSAETSAEVSAEPAPLAVVPAASTPAPGYASTVIGRGPTTAASSTTVRNLDFDLRPRTSPNDVLRVVPGLLAVQHQGGGKADQLFLRGFDADHGTDVGVFVDGVPVNMGSHAHGQGFADLHWLIPETLERIDVMKGPYDVRYGDFSTADAVNLITRDKLDSSSIQYTLGMLPTVAGRAVASGRFVGIVAPELPGWASKLHPWIAFEAAYDKGPFIASEDLERYNLFSKVTYDVTPRFKVGVFFQAYGSGWIGSGQIPSRDVANIGRFGSEDPTEGGQTERQMFTAFARYHGGDQEVEATVYVTRYKLALFNDFTFFLNDPVHGDEIEQDDSRVFSGAKISYHFHRRWHGISFRSTAGAEMRYDGIHVDRWNVESQDGDFRKRLGRLNVTSLGAPGADDDIDILNIAGYAEEDVVFSRWLRVIAAVRADFFGFDVDDQGEVLGAAAPATTGTRQFTQISPKATVVLTALPELLEIYLNFGEGFHSNMAQVALNDGKTVTNAAGETFKLHAIPKYYGGEIGVRSHLWNRLDLAAALWASYLENETTFDADAGTFTPSAPTRRIGVDFEARAQLLSWLFADFDLAQASSTAVANSGNGGAVALAPKLYMTGGVTARHRLGLRGGLRFRYLGARPAFDESSPEYQYFTSRTWNGKDNPDYDPARVTAQGYFIVDAYGAYRWRHLEVGFSIQNLFNSLWREAQFGNRSCTYDETHNPNNPNYSGSGNQLGDGTYANRCGIGYAVTPGSGANTRSGVTDVHYTPGIPFNLQLTAKVYF
jgi:TonB family protein